MKREFYIFNITKKYLYLIPRFPGRTLLVMEMGVYRRSIRRNDINTIKNPTLIKINDEVVILTDGEWEGVQEKPIKYNILKLYEYDLHNRFKTDLPLYKLSRRLAYKDVLRANVIGRQRKNKNLDKIS
jgi:hypothetical protein